VKNAIRLIFLVALATAANAAQVYAQHLDAAMSRFSAAWRQSDDKAIASLIAREGATIETTDGRLGPLGPRQAAAVLRILFEGRDTRGVRTRQMQDVGGTPQKAYAEVIWTTLAPETTQAMRVVVFVEWVLEHDKQWRITRIRLLTP
jgi:predicted flavoprotein YhiN